MSSSLRLLILAVVMATSISGCYREAVVPVPTPPAPMPSALVGIVMVDGEQIAVDGGGYAELTETEMTLFDSEGATVQSILTWEVRELLIRERDGTRTWLAVGAIAAALGIGAFQLLTLGR